MSPRPSIRPNTHNYRDLFLNNTPLMDVRAPVEFHKGAFPGSCNIPLLDDQQRELIGTRYKEQGQDAAIDLGWKLATPEIQQQRIEAWLAHIKQHPQGYLYCFRGGLRSNLSQQLIRDSEVDYPLVEGGYKAMRRFLIDELENSSPTLPLALISGRTGSGKTLAIHELMAQPQARAIDLEGMANHRGSAFGRQIQPQPVQIDFENTLSIAILKQQAASARCIFTEDEGRMIGGVTLPPAFTERMKQAPMVVLETPIERRIDIALADYVTDAQPQYQQRFGEEQGNLEFREQILGNLQRIRRRLGGDRHQHLQALFTEALDELERSGCADAFRPGIKVLLCDYYDPMYDYQKGLREGRDIFRGEQDELLAWAESYHPT